MGRTVSLPYGGQISTRATMKLNGLALAMPERRKEYEISIVKLEMTKDEEPRENWTKKN